MGPLAAPLVEHREFIKVLGELTHRRPRGPVWTAHEAGAFETPLAEGEAAVISGSRLEWPGASPEQLAFMRAVYDKQVELSKAAGGTFTADLPGGQLGVIYNGHQARKDAAAAARRLLAEARTALTAAGLADKVRIGIVSAYRPASLQFTIWQGKGRKGGFPYYYRQMLQRGVLRPGDYGPKAVAAVAREMRGWIAAPGYSNHQDGLAIDFGTGTVGKPGLAVIGKRAWFHKWLVANAHRFGFHPYDKEAWHWTYRGSVESEAGPSTPAAGGAAARVLCVPRVPLLAGHRGGPPDLILRWNVPSAPKVIDVVVHLHGYWYPGMRLDRDIERVSGLDLASAGGPRRSRPTLTILPKGHDTGVRQKIRQKDGTYRDGFTVFTFPSLVTKDGLTDLVRFSLDRFAARVGGKPPQVGRLILTAHSGGGAALLQILRYHNPHQVHVFDALYQDASTLANWASCRIQQDRAALRTLGAPAAREYMSTRGGALRVFYQDRIRGGTRPFSLKLRQEIPAELGPGLEPWYRVEASKYDHFQIPSRYGWRLLADASADLPGAYREPATHREVGEFDDSDIAVAPVDRDTGFGAAMTAYEAHRRRRTDGAPAPAVSTSPSPASSPDAAVFTRRTPASRRYPALVALLDRHRGDIPLDFLLGWIDVESNGRIDVTTSINERGFFQIHPAESKDHRFQHERLTTDPDYSVRAGIELVRVYVALARKRYPWIQFGSPLFWRIVKLQHAMGSGLTKTMLSDMQRRGVPPTSWDAITAYELTEAAQRLHRLLRVKPGRFGRNVDAVFTRGRQIAKSLGR